MSRTTEYVFSENPPEGLVIFSPAYLATQPTLATGQADDLKLETDQFRGVRYWLARCGREDGEEWEVHVEWRRPTDGFWRPLTSYRGVDHG